MAHPTFDTSVLSFTIAMSNFSPSDVESEPFANYLEWLDALFALYDVPEGEKLSSLEVLLGAKMYWI